MLDVRADLMVEGDVLVQCCDRLSMMQAGGSKKLFHFWFNTVFVRDNYLCLTKMEIDGPHTDTKDEKWFGDLRVELFFAAGEAEDWRTSVRGWEAAAASGGRSGAGASEAAVSPPVSPLQAVQAERRRLTRERSHKWQTQPVEASQTVVSGVTGAGLTGGAVELPVLDGWIGKKHGKRWNLRHFVLQPKLGVINYYDDENQQREATGRKRAPTKMTQGTRGILLQDIEFASIQPFLDDESRHDHREFQFTYRGKAYQLRAKDEDSRDEWVAALTAAVQCAKDVARPLIVDGQEPVALPPPPVVCTRGADVEQATAADEAPSFPSGLANQIRLASAMLQMQGYSPEMLLQEQRRMATLLSGYQAAASPATGDASQQAPTAPDPSDYDDMTMALIKEQARLPAGSSPESVYYSPLGHDDRRGFSDDSDLEEDELPLLDELAVQQQTRWATAGQQNAAGVQPPGAQPIGRRAPSHVVHINGVPTIVYDE